MYFYTRSGKTHTPLCVILLLISTVTGCSDPPATAWQSRVNSPCGETPNCVSTLDVRHDFTLQPFILTPKGQQQWQQIEQLALSLPGAKRAHHAHDYVHIEATSKVFRFIDDFEVTRKGQRLHVRSASRIGYSDFGVNRKRADAFRFMLINQRLIEK